MVFPPHNVFISYGPIQTSPMAHLASSTVVTRSFCPTVKSGQCLVLSTHP